MSDLEAVAALSPERLERLFPLCVGRPVSRLVSGRQYSVLVIVAFLDNGANFVLFFMSVQDHHEPQKSHSLTLENSSFSSHSRN